VQGPSKACIAFITNGQKIAGFVSDGNHASSWFATSDLESGKLTIFSRQGFQLGEATISGDSVSGEIALLSAGQVLQEGLHFEGRRATGTAGLYVAAAKNGPDSFEAGWVVLPDGSECGTVDTFLHGTFDTNPAPKLKATVSIPPFGTQLPHQQTSVYFDVNPQAPS
jgi:hypothetical protein